LYQQTLLGGRVIRIKFQSPDGPFVVPAAPQARGNASFIAAAGHDQQLELQIRTGRQSALPKIFDNASSFRLVGFAELHITRRRAVGFCLAVSRDLRS
jgi:hypothetical protein